MRHNSKELINKPSFAHEKTSMISEKESRSPMVSASNLQKEFEKVYNVVNTPQSGREHAGGT
jgi:hypothetical protein